jgi:hypothetical protein
MLAFLRNLLNRKRQLPEAASLHRLLDNSNSIPVTAEAIALAIEGGADVDEVQYGTTPIARLLRDPGEKNVLLVRELCSLGATPSSRHVLKNVLGRNSSVRSVELLVELGVSAAQIVGTVVGETTHGGSGLPRGRAEWTPLHSAVARCNLVLTKKFLELGADANAQGIVIKDPPTSRDPSYDYGSIQGQVVYSGVTPLHAVMQLINQEFVDELPEIVQELLSHGASEQRGPMKSVPDTYPSWLSEIERKHEPVSPIEVIQNLKQSLPSLNEIQNSVSEIFIFATGGGKGSPIEPVEQRENDSACSDPTQIMDLFEELVSNVQESHDWALENGFPIPDKYPKCDAIKDLGEQIHIVAGLEGMQRACAVLNQRCHTRDGGGKAFPAEYLWAGIGGWRW